MERIEIKYELDEQAVVAAAKSIHAAESKVRNLGRTQWAARWLGWPFTLALVYWAVVYLWYELAPVTLREWVTRRDLVVAGVAVLAPCGVWIASRFRDHGSLPHCIRTLLLKTRAGRLLGPVTLEVSDDGIRYRAQGLNLSFNWQNFEGVDSWSSSEHFLLWTRFGMTLAIPKRALPEHVRDSFLETCSAASRAALTHVASEEDGSSIRYESSTTELAALRLYFLRRARGRYYVPLWLLFSSLPFAIWSLLLALMLILPWLRDRPPAWEEHGWLTVIVYCFIAIACGTAPFVVYWSNSEAGARRWAQRQILRGAVSPSFLGHHVAVIAPDGFHEVGNGVDNFVDWQNFAKIEVWNRHLFLCRDFSARNVSGHIVPRSAFSSEQAFIEFVAKAEAYWQNAIAGQKT